MNRLKTFKVSKEIMCVKGVGNGLKNSDFILTDNKRNERPSQVNRMAIKIKVKNEPSISVQGLAYCPHSSDLE